MNPASSDRSTPLAERMRPEKLEHFFGQRKLLGEGRLLGQLIGSQTIPSLILWGPPGSGKTSLAKIIAQSTESDFVYFSAVLSGVKEVRKIVDIATHRKTDDNVQTILFVDEIHRFNKSQQDGFLPHVESGLLTLIGATTENPSFQVIAPLLSRCRVLVLEPLTGADLSQIFRRALDDHSCGLGSDNLDIEEKGLELIVEAADGDARRGLNILEVAAALVASRRKDTATREIISADDVSEAAQQRTLRYDKNGEEHYNLISALHKSLRDSDPDGALYWYYRMIEAGEDPLYIGRRLVRFASEDIGIADPQALVQAMACRDAYHILGTPEGELALAQAVAYLATAPKSNAVYSASKQIRKLIHKTGSLPVPMHIRNAPTSLMKSLGYGKGYKYAHDNRDGIVNQDHLPDKISGISFYQPTNRGYEAVVKDRLEKWRKILQKKKQ